MNFIQKNKRYLRDDCETFFPEGLDTIDLILTDSKLINKCKDFESFATTFIYTHFANTLVIDNPKILLKSSQIVAKDISKMRGRINDEVSVSLGSDDTYWENGGDPWDYVEDSDIDNIYVSIVTEYVFPSQLQRILSKNKVRNRNYSGIIEFLYQYT